LSAAALAGAHAVKLQSWIALINEEHILNLPVIVLGGAGHAKVLVSTLLLQHRRVLGFVDVNPALPPLLGIPHLGDDGAVFLHPPDQVRLVNGVGSIGSTALRRAVYERFREKQYTFETVIHPAATIAPEVHIEDGVQVMAGVVVQPGSRLGANVIINTGARIDHDCLIDAHAHVAPGVTLSGNVHIGSGAHIGTGATIIQGVKVGAAAIVGAGAVVIGDVPAGVTVIGIPAAPLAKPIASRS
jgi:UDP-perosamine 4-acetyltransferase